MIDGRGERIRTSDLSVPNRAHYQAVLRPVPLTPKRPVGAAIVATVSTNGQGQQKIAGGGQRARAMADCIFDV